MNKLLLSLLALIALAIPSLAQQGAFPNYPIVGGASYCASTSNGVCTSTIPAGPTILTGSEQLPANTELANGRSPQNVLVTPAALNANPITFFSVVPAIPPATAISTSNINGGVFFISSVTITQANVTLPLSAIQGQQYQISSNQTITTLVVTAPAGDTMGTNAAPTVLTVSTTAPQGYNFIYNKTSKIWHRMK